VNGKTKYLTTQEALLIHAILLRKYGGAEGLRDAGLLEAALFRPQTGYYTDIIQEASALMESLAINHCFVDGNKRVAFGVTDVFLRINGYRMNCDGLAVYSEMMLMFDNKEFNFTNIDRFLRNVVVKK
jgi:death-on-curing protein